MAQEAANHDRSQANFIGMLAVGLIGLSALAALLVIAAAMTAG